MVTPWLSSGIAVLKRFIIFLFFALMGYLVYANYLFSHRPLLLQKTMMVTTVKVYPGFHLTQLAHELKTQQLWAHPNSFIVLAMIHGYLNQLRFGEYVVTPQMTASDLLHHIASSTGLARHSFRIREGETLRKIMLAIDESGNFFKTRNPLSIHYLGTIAFNYPASLEGLLYPDTYEFAWGMTDRAMIQMAYSHMIKQVTTSWSSRDVRIPLQSPYQLLIVASLIETEASDIKERPIIAGVLYNRLRRHMRLQVDPTVMYGLNLPYGTVLEGAQLKISTPYNTYMMNGLPPTPIAMPSLASIEAAAHPAATSALYYVANGQGAHVFSDTYAQHRQAIVRYRAFIEAEGNRGKIDHH